MLLISLGMLFLLGIGFSILFIRSQNIFLVGLIHGLMDYPLTGMDTNLSFIILLAAIAFVEFIRFLKREKGNEVGQTAR